MLRLDESVRPGKTFVEGLSEFPIGTPNSGASWPAPTIFHEAWWLAITAGASLSEVTVLKDNKIAGRLPFMQTRIFPGLRVITMLPMTRMLGPDLAPAYANAGLRSLKPLTISRQLISQLPKADHISLRMHPGVADTLAFGEAGFRTTVDFTVEIPPGPPETVWRSMRDKTRNVIRRASEIHRVEECFDASWFQRFYELNLHARGLENAYNGDMVLKIISAALERGVGRIIVARGVQGKEQGALFTVWDRRAAYYFMSSRAADAMNGVGNLLIWDAIQHAHAKKLTFDMDFLHIKNRSLPNHLLLTGFGGVIKPRFMVSRTSPALRLIRDLRSSFRR